MSGVPCTADSLTAAIDKAASKPDGDAIHMAGLRHDKPIRLDVRYPHFSVDVAALQRQVTDPPRQHELPPSILPTAAAGAPAFHLGLSARTVTDSDLASTGLSKPQGVIVTNVEKGSIADQMQVHAGDIIQQVNGADVNDPAAIAQVIRSGEAKNLRVWRKGRTLDLSIPLSM